MGKSRNTYTVKGTKCNPQISLLQENAELKARELAKKDVKWSGINSKDEMIKPLVEAGVKFNEEDVIFTTKDKSGQLIWLEKGNNLAGFEHIKKHTNDFVKKHGIKAKDLLSHIKDIIENGEIVSSRIVLRNGKLGLEKRYLYNNKYYVLGAIGINGYVVTMYPRSKGENKWL